MRRLRLGIVFGLAGAALVIFCAVRAQKVEAKIVTSAEAKAPATTTVPRRAVLVELFTSEGCSSCPPADELLRAIDGKVTQDGLLVVGVSEHVTYWDHGGWKDPYDADTFTERQEQYARRFHLDSVYTPQMVVNGEAQFVGSDRGALVAALEKTGANASVHIDSAKLVGDNVEATVSFAGAAPRGGAEMMGVIAEDETTAHVLRGENEGRSLSHASVARTLVKLATVGSPSESMVRLKLPDGPAGMRRHLIVWVQEPDTGHVLGVDSQVF